MATTTTSAGARFAWLTRCGDVVVGACKPGHWRSPFLASSDSSQVQSNHFWSLKLRIADNHARE